ncbi:transcriptional regulatory, LysR-family [Bordetella petrii]|uniref:Transcriptional regulatory, LysR-family n=2 Tax=Bordetella petrii TaxID=94624 RepID=A9IDP8_BORPD|nr:transcriptional regulatory, LysR-family [Bordetella petrii]
MKMRHLTVLVAIAEHGSVTRAADDLGVSQSALTQTLAEIESIFGSPLFSRTSRGVLPTELGNMALIRAKRMLQDIDLWERDVTAMQAGHRAHLNLGAVPHVSGHLLTRTVRMLVQDHGMSLTLHRGNTRHLLRLLRERRVDCTICRVPADEDMCGLSHRLLYEQRPALVANRSLARHLKQRVLTLGDLRQARWILPLPDTPTRQRVNEAFRRQGLAPPVPVLETDSAEVVLDMLATDDALVSLVPEDLAVEMNATGAVLRLAMAFDWALPAIHLISAQRETPLAAEAHLAATLTALRQQDMQSAQASPEA